MAYPDDKSMTKMGRNVHVPVTSEYYTIAMALLTTRDSREESVQAVLD
jgi:hypothetical protein